MRTASDVLFFIYLFLMAIYDIKKRKIQLECSAVVAVLLAIQQVCIVYRGEISIAGVFWGMMVGVVLIGLSILTKGAIGVGDGILFVISGLFLGIYENGILLLLSLFFTAIAGGFLIMSKHVGKTYTLPFVPFVFIGYGVMCVWKMFG